MRPALRIERTLATRLQLTRSLTEHVHCLSYVSDAKRWSASVLVCIAGRRTPRLTVELIMHATLGVYKQIDTPSNISHKTHFTHCTYF